MAQTRNEAGETRQFETIEEAFGHALIDTSVWKVSFTINDIRYRFVLDENDLWKEEPIETERKSYTLRRRLECFTQVEVF